MQQGPTNGEESMTRNPFALLLGVGTGAALIALTLSGSGTAAAEETALQFQTARVSTTTTGAEATVGGTVVPFKQVTLTAQIPGRVIFMPGIEGHAEQVVAVKARRGDRVR